MDTRFTENQEMIRDAASAYLKDWSDANGFRKQTDRGKLDYASVWNSFGVDLGFAGLTIPEAHGGSGLGDLERALVMEEMGKCLFISPYFGTCVLAADVLKTSGERAAADILGWIAAGSVTATFCRLTDGASSGERLSGLARNVIDGATADLILVLSGDRLYAVERDGTGIEVNHVPSLDPTRPLGDIRFHDAPGQLIAKGAGLSEALTSAEAHSAIALAAEQTGGAEAMLNATIAYTLERKQFGRLIGSFQAVKHRCADMMVLVEAARSAVYQAAALAHGSDLMAQAAIAKSECSDAYFTVAGDAIQMHGGVGVTWEYDMHFHFKRARAGKALLGSPQSWREKLASYIGVKGAAA